MKARLEVYNVLGQCVSTLVDAHLEAGEHTYQFSASGRSSGIYFYRLQAGEVNVTKKMVFMK